MLKYISDNDLPADINEDKAIAALLQTGPALEHMRTEDDSIVDAIASLFAGAGNGENVSKRAWNTATKKARAFLDDNWDPCRARVGDISMLRARLINLAICAATSRDDPDLFGSKRDNLLYVADQIISSTGCFYRWTHEPLNAVKQTIASATHPVPMPALQSAKQDRRPQQ